MTMMTPLCTSLLVHCTRPLSFWPPYSRLFLSLHCAKSIHPAQQQQQQQQEKQQHLAALWAQTIKGRNKRKKKKKNIQEKKRKRRRCWAEEEEAEILQFVEKCKLQKCYCKATEGEYLGTWKGWALYIASPFRKMHLNGAQAICIEIS